MPAFRTEYSLSLTPAPPRKQNRFRPSNRAYLFDVTVWYNGRMKLRQSLVWDSTPENIDLKKNARYVIERVLDFGDPSEVRWLFRQYSKERIKQVMNLPRVQLSPKSKALWSLLVQ